MNTYEVRQFKTSRSKQSTHIGYFNTLEQAKEAAGTLKYYSIAEYTETITGIITRTFGQYYFKNF